MIASKDKVFWRLLKSTIAITAWGIISYFIYHEAGLVTAIVMVVTFLLILGLSSQSKNLGDAVAKFNNELTVLTTILEKQNAKNTHTKKLH